LTLASRLRESKPRAIRSFLIARTDTEFRKRYVELDPQILREDVSFGNPLIRDSQSEFFIVAGREGLLSTSDREDITERWEAEIVDYGDVTFLLNDRYVSFLGTTGHAKLMEAARVKLAPRFADLISDMSSDCDADDPEAYFENQSEALEALRNLFPDDEDVDSYVDHAFSTIEETVSEINDKPVEPSSDFWEDHKEQLSSSGYQSQTTSSSDNSINPDENNSVFDDIDS
jgi:hypothetical protein